jgi:hypothetical protein
MNRIPMIEAACFRNRPDVRFGMSTRVGGVSPAPFGMNTSFNVGDDEENVRANRQRFLAALDVVPEELAIPRQVHSNVVKVADKPGSYVECDALITAERRVFLSVSVADCVPIFLFDPREQVVAAIHAGWRGTAAGIVERCLEMLQTTFSSKPSNLLAFVGPAAGSCCYVVGEDVAERFAPAFVHRANGLRYVDLKAANVAQLQSVGVPPEAIEVSPLCTITESRLLHSFRRDRQKSGRMMGIIGLL